MTYHQWGDESFDWKSLYDAERWIVDYVKRWSKCSLISKEKYGTIRYEHIVPPYGHVVRKVRKVGNIILPFIWNESWIYRKWQSYGYMVLWKGIQKACKRWPHIKDELLEDFAANEEIVGKEIHDQYWEKV